MKYALRMTAAQHSALRDHLFPGDGNEAVALLVCGRRAGDARHIFTTRRVVPVPYNDCDRRPDRITWPTDTVEALMREFYGARQAIIKIHSHRADYRRFSAIDDASDRSLFSSIVNFLGDELPHASAVMLPDGELFGRVLGDDGRIVGTLGSISVVGDDLRLWGEDIRSEPEGFALRHAQAFGKGTTSLLRRLSVAVIGCSGTGSVVIEQLARLGVGRLVLVDPDAVEEKNLNRILNSGKEDAYLGRAKVHVLASAIARMGLGQEVLPIAGNLISANVVRSVAECDAVFGCMDGVEGRHMLNRLAAFYTLPYFDVGIRLDADGNGGIERISGAVHYLQPGLSSLLSREVYSMARVEAEEIRRTNPEMYRWHVKEGYLRGVDEDRPAVISVNMFFAALAVNDFLARLHPYRNQPNSQYAYLGGSLTDLQFYPEVETAPCPILQRHVGRGDVEPLLERPALMMRLFQITWRAVQGLYCRWKYRKRLRALRTEELPEGLEPKRLYVLGSCHPWSAALLCPCGCGETIHLSLLEKDSPRWSLYIDAFGLPTLSPSIWRTKGCRSHFFLRQGSVVWCAGNQA